MVENSAYFEIGVIIKPQGIKGEMRVFPTTDDPERFALLTEVTVSLPGKPDTVYKLTSSRCQKNLIIIQLKGINDRNAAETLTHGVLKIPPEKALPLDKDEYYIRDLIGLHVFSDTGSALGILNEVLSTGANDVYIVKTPDNKEILLPAIKDCIREVSLEEKKLIVHLMEGLLP